MKSANVKFHPLLAVHGQGEITTDVSFADNSAESSDITTNVKTLEVKLNIIFSNI